MDVAKTLTAKTLCRVERNDPTLTKLVLLGMDSGRVRPNTVAEICQKYRDHHYGVYYPMGTADLESLGAVVGNNTNLEQLTICVGSASLARLAAGSGFWGELKRNTSINYLLMAACDLRGGLEGGILDEFVANNDNLTSLSLVGCRLDARRVDTLTSALSGLPNLKWFALDGCGVDDGLLGEFVSRHIRLQHLHSLDLSGNNLGRTGCEAITALLKDSNCQLCLLDLSKNHSIDDNCAKILANSLNGNSELVSLHLSHCAVTARGLDAAFSTVLCNSSTVNGTYLSNHTLRFIEYHGDLPTNLSSLLRSNPIKKILRAHPELDMTNMLRWDQKLLPRAVVWFEKAGQCSNAESDRVGAKKLSAIFQFVRAFPMTAVPPTAHELAMITQHHGLRLGGNKDEYVVGDRVYTSRPASGPWGYVVGHTRSSVFVTMDHTNIGGEIHRKKNDAVWSAPILSGEVPLAARRQREQLEAITLRRGLKQVWNVITRRHRLEQVWNEDGYVVGDKVYVNPFVMSSSCPNPKRHCGIWGYVVGHTRSSVWIAVDHTRVGVEILERKSSSVSKTPMQR